MSSALRLFESKDWKTEAHNQGQEDAAAGKPREAPYPIPITGSTQEANRLYNEGYDHTKSQQ